MSIRNLTTTSRCQDILDKYSTKNVTQNEILCAIRGDMQDRVNNIESSLINLLSSEAADIFVKVRTNGEAPQGRYYLLAGSMTVENYLKGRKKVTSDEALSFQRLLRQSYGDQFSIFPAVETPELGTVSSRCSLEMKNTDLDPYNGLNLIDSNGIVYIAKSIIRLSYDDAAAQVLSVVTRQDDETDDITGYYIESLVPTDAFFVDYTTSPSYPQYELFSWDSFIKNQIENASTYDLLSQAVDAAVLGKEDLTDYITKVRAKYNGFSSSCSAVLDLISGNGLSIKGVCSTLSTFFSGMDSGVADDSDHFHFADNSLYLPESCLTGVITGLVSAVGAVITTIGLFTSKVLGVIGLILSAAAQAIGKIFGYMDKKYISVQVDSNGTVSAFSPGLIQLEVEYGSLRDSIRDSILFSGAEIFDAPGFKVIAFIKDLVTNADGSINGASKVGLECHISYDVAPSDALFDWFAQFYSWDSVNQGYVWTLPRLAQIEAKYEEAIDDQESISSLLSSMDDGALDDFFRRNYLVNLFFTWFYLLAGFSNSAVYNVKDIVTADGVSPMSNLLWNSADWLAKRGSSSAFEFTWNDFMDPSASHSLTGLFNSMYINSRKTWENIVAFDNAEYLCDLNQSGLTSLTFSEVFLLKLGEASVDPYFITPLQGDVSFVISPAKYSSETFWLAVITVGLITAAVVATTIAATVKIKKSITAWNAKHQAKVEAAWTAYTEDPTNENYAAYKSAAFKNNWLTKLTGGTKYSYTNYWEDTSSSDQTEGLSSRLSKYLIGGPDEESAEECSLPAIRRLITGR